MPKSKSYYEDLQKTFFEQIAAKMLPHQSLVDEVAEILDIGVDGAYRRKRADSFLKFNELVQLAEKFQISLDELIHGASSDAVVFRPSGLGQVNLDFESYLESLLKLVSHIQVQKVQKGYFAAKDIPVFHLFQFPELARFKMFFWQKTIFNAPDLAGEKFHLGEMDEKMERCISLCRQIADKYSQIPTIEIWNEETSVSILKQILYYYEAGLFAGRKDAIRLLEMVQAYFEHLQQEAGLGYKFLAGNPPANRVENFELYYNDLILIDNVIHLEYENDSQTFLVYNSIEYLATANDDFNGQVTAWIQNLLRKSDLISKVAEKQRNRFFHSIFRRIERLKEDLD
ncbi:MAG: hypothetical protein AAF399_04780 [Bacteroidota bacterium]